MISLILKSEGMNIDPWAFLAFKALVDTKWDGKEEISVLMSRLDVYQHALMPLGFPLKDKICVFVLLYSLPDTHKNVQLWSTITSSIPKGDMLTFAHIEAHFTMKTLIYTARKHPVLSEATPSESTLSATLSRLSQGPKFHCSLHKVNASHNTLECFALKKQENKKKSKKGRKGKEKGGAHSAQEEVSDSEKDDGSSGYVQPCLCFPKIQILDFYLYHV